MITHLTKTHPVNASNEMHVSQGTLHSMHCRSTLNRFRSTSRHLCALCANGALPKLRRARRTAHDCSLQHLILEAHRWNNAMMMQDALGRKPENHRRGHLLVLEQAAPQAASRASFEIE